jgi:hypothetical protein
MVIKMEMAEGRGSSLSLLQTCKQIHSEAHLFAFSTIPFHLHGDSTRHVIRGDWVWKEGRRGLHCGYDQ